MVEGYWSRTVICSSDLESQVTFMILAVGWGLLYIGCGLPLDVGSCEAYILALALGVCVKAKQACLSLSRPALLTTAAVLWLPQHGTPSGTRLDCRIHCGDFGGVPPGAVSNCSCRWKKFSLPSR